MSITKIKNISEVSLCFQCTICRQNILSSYIIRYCSHANSSKSLVEHEGNKLKLLIKSLAKIRNNIGEV